MTLPRAMSIGWEERALPVAWYFQLKGESSSDAPLL